MALRAGSETGSLINHISSGPQAVQPAVGVGITLLHWTDRSAGTISRVSASGKSFWYRCDEATRVDSNGMSECQDYEYTPQPDAPEVQVRQRKDGSWRDALGHGVAIGARRAYHDYSY